MPSLLQLLIFILEKNGIQGKKKLRRKIKANNRNINPPPRAPPAPKRPRAKVRRGKAKRALKITGLDLLHSQTLLSTSPQGNFKLTVATFHKITVCIPFMEVKGQGLLRRELLFFEILHE